MKPIRLAIVAQRFWPRVGSLETRVEQLACGLADCGAEVTLVTARWDAHWPVEIGYHGIPVVRLDRRPRPRPRPRPWVHGARHGARHGTDMPRRWNTWRWARSLARWLQRHGGQFDLICVWGLMYEARTAVQVMAQAAGNPVPVVLVPERIGWHGDCFRQVHVSGGRGIKSACLRARALVASSPAARQELEAAGYPRERIVDVPLGVPRSPPRSEHTQAEARSLLAEANAALQLAAHAPLAVSTSRLEAGGGWEQLLAAWSIVARQNVAARLWLAGEAPAAAAVAQRIAFEGLAGCVG